MENEFNYEDVFMGVMEGKQKTYYRTFKDDYRLKRLTESLKTVKGKLLDIGCGGGITTESLPYYYPQAKVYGCDVSKKAIDYARKFGSGKVTYGVIRGKKLPYKDNTFDVCICLDVMEHIPDVDFFLKEVKRILKKGGEFFLIVPCEGQVLTHTWLWQKLGIGQNMTFKRYGHIHPEFTHLYVKNLLKEKGFKIQKTMYSEHFLYQLISVLTYFVPLELMDLFLGKKAVKYSDRGVIKAMSQKKRKFDVIMSWRHMWMFFINIIRNLSLFELDVFKNTSVSAWKLVVLSKTKK